MKENNFKLAKERSRRYPTETITNVDYADDIGLLAKTPTQAETLLHCLKRTTGGIGRHVNADKTHLHTTGRSFETSGQVHLPRKQCLMNRE